MKHWTKSELKGGSEFGGNPLWEMWINSLQKVKYNESNWISNNGGSLTVSEKIGDDATYSKVPFMTTTNKLAVIIVDISKSSTTPLKQVRLTAYDPDTGSEVACTRTEAISTTSKRLSKEYAGKPQYLSYTYCILTFTPSTTYVNESGFVIKKRVNLKVSVNDGGFKVLETVGYKTFMKFIEIGESDLTGGHIIPVTGETIPAAFFSSFYSLLTGDLYDESVGLRYLNYIIPVKGDVGEGINKVYPEVNLKNSSVLLDIMRMNNAVSYITGSNYYQNMKAITSVTLQDVWQYYTVNGDNESYNYQKSQKVSYTHWKENNLVGWEQLPNSFTNDTIIALKKIGFELPSLSTINIASGSILPGFEETATNDIFEFYGTPGTQLHKQPVDNVSMSIIKSTFNLPFWKNKRINEVLVLKGHTLGSDGSNVTSYQDFDTRESPGYFTMVLEMTNTGLCDIVESTAGLYIKFYF